MLVGVVDGHLHFGETGAYGEGLAKRVAVAVGSRATWSSVQSVVSALGERAVVLAYGSALSDRYGSAGIAWPENTVRLTTLLDGDHSAATQTSALTMSAVGQWLANNQVDWLVVNGDRTEQLGAATAAAFQNVPICHLMSGEQSGSIDDRVRWAITSLSDVCCASTEAAYYHLVNLGQTAHFTGCPRIDHVAKTLEDPSINGLGRCILVAFHPVTTEGDCGDQMRSVLDAVMRFRTEHMPVCLVWPNSDPGSEAIVGAIRPREDVIQTYRKLSPERWTKAMQECAVVVGNSSSPLREGSFIGVPCVNIGTRQAGRERGPNVVDVPPITSEIVAAIGRQLTHGPFERSLIYGDGRAAERVCEVLS